MRQIASPLRARSNGIDFNSARHDCLTKYDRAWFKTLPAALQRIKKQPDNGPPTLDKNTAFTLENWDIPPSSSVVEHWPKTNRKKKVIFSHSCPRAKSPVVLTVALARKKENKEELSRLRNCKNWVKEKNTHTDKWVALCVCVCARVCASECVWHEMYLNPWLYLSALESQSVWLEALSPANLFVGSHVYGVKNEKQNAAHPSR